MMKDDAADLRILKDLKMHLVHANEIVSTI